MPRFLGKDYYHEDFTERRHLSAHTALTVPCCFKEGEHDHTILCHADVYGILQQDFHGDLQKIEDTGDVESLPFDLDTCSATSCGTEPLEWTTRWKEFEGNYVEIVPSSNPESNSSFFDSQPDSLPDLCVAEEFFVIPLRALSKGSALGQLEEPISVQNLHQSVQMTISMLQLVTGQIDPGLSCTDKVTTDEDPDLSETTVFGKDDQHMQAVSELDKEKSVTADPPQVFAEKYEPYIFPQAKAEEVMCLVSSDDLLPCSPSPAHAVHGVVSEARAACTEHLEASPPVPATVHLDKAEPDHCLSLDADLPHMEDFSVIKHPVVQGLEKLVLSTVVKSQHPDFLSLNMTHDMEDAGKIKAAAVLESPLYLHTSPPLKLDLKVTHDAASLHPWSPGSLSAHSPLLSVQDSSKLERTLWQAEACFGGIQALKFREPNVLNQDQKPDQLPQPVSAALHLAACLEPGGNLGRLELDLTWDISPTLTHPPLPACPEMLLLLDPTSDPEPVEWKLSFDFETIEAMVDHEIGKKTVQDADCGEDSIVRMDAKESPDEVVLHVPAMEDTGKAGVCRQMPTKKGLKGEQIATISTTASAVSGAESMFSGNSPTVTQPAPIVTTAGNVPGVEARLLAQKTLRNKAVQLSHTVGEETAPSMGWKSCSPQKDLDILHVPAVLQATAQSDSSTSTHISSLQPASTGIGGERHKAGHWQTATENLTEKPEDTLCPDTEDPTLDGFSLQFDDEDFVLGSDSFDEDNPPADRTDQTDTMGWAVPTVDPVDNFLLLRDARRTTTATHAAIKGHSVVKAAPQTQTRSNPHPGIITPMSTVPRSVSDSEQRFLTVALSGECLKALQELSSQAEPQLQWLKVEGVVSHDATFMSLKPDYTRFLLKDRLSKLGSTGQESGDSDELYKSLVMVHTLRSAANLLEQCCLESAIVHLTAMQDQYLSLKGRLDGLRKALFQHQFTAQQAGQLHPKVAAVCREIQQHRHAHHSLHKVLVVLRRDQPTLVKTLQSAVSMDGTVIKVLAAGDMYWPDDSECLITWDQAAVNSMVTRASLVLEFEADRDSPLCKTCRLENIDYVGLCTALDQQVPQLHQEGRVVSSQSGDGSVTVVGSQQLIQNQQLLQLLETRHDVIVLRRDYPSVGRVHYPDVVVSLHKGAVLLHVRQLREEGGLEQLVERLTAVGLQLTTVWVFVHSLGDAARSVFGRDTVKKMAQLQALMANLSSAAEGFTTTYKVVICKTASDIALYVHYLATSSTHHPGSTQMGTDSTDLPQEMSKEEGFLLGFPCLNSFSCHLLLSRATVGEVMSMSRDQLHSLFPELPDSVTENLYRVISMDTGLQLRPHPTDIHHPQSLDHNSPSQLPEHQLSLSPTMDRDMGSVGSVSPHNDEHFPVHAMMAPGSDRQAELSVGLSLEGEKSDFISPEISQQDCPLSMSRRLQHTDQPTPLLLPSQQPPLGDRESGRCGSVDVGSNGREAAQLSEDCGISATSQTAQQQNSRAMFLRSSRRAVYGGEAFQPQSPENSMSHSSNSYPALHDTIQRQHVGAYYDACDTITWPGSINDSLSQSHSFLPAPLNSHQQPQPLSQFSAADGTGHVPQDREEQPRTPQMGHSKFMDSVRGLPPPFSPSRNQKSFLSAHATFDDSSLPADLRQSSDTNQRDVDTAGRVSVHHVLSTGLLGPKTESLTLPRSHSEFQLEQGFGAFPTPAEAEVELSRQETTRSHNPLLRGSSARAVKGFFPDNSVPVSDVSATARSHSLNQIASERDTLFHGHFEACQDPVFSFRDQSHSHQSPGPRSSFVWQANNSEHSDLSDTARGPGLHCRLSHPTSLADLSAYSRVPSETFGLHSSSAETSDYHKRLDKTSNYHGPFGKLHYKQNQLETLDFRGFQVETSNDKSPTVEGANNRIPSGETAANYHIPSAGDASNHRISSVGTSDYYIPAFESSAGSMHGGGEEVRWMEQPEAGQCITSGPVLKPSFPEDLAATTRRLLQGRSPPAYLYGSHHGYHRPRTPARRISIGLAQPLRRSDSGSQDSGKADADKLSQPSPKPLSQLTSSPPLDMAGDGPVPDTKLFQGISAAAKLKKWSAQLKFKQNRPFNLDTHSDDLCPSAKRRRAVGERRLTYLPIPGAGGQTKLAFL